GPSGSCDEIWFGINQPGQPFDPGAYATYSSSIDRTNGNLMTMTSSTGVTGRNAGLFIPYVTIYYYRDSGSGLVLINSTTMAAAGYGLTVNASLTQALYSNGQYSLGTFRSGNPAANQNHHTYRSPVCEQLYPTRDWIGYYSHWYDSSGTS